MKIIIATALYPPEIEDLATYSKEVAQNLQKNHQVTVLAYANKVENSEGLNIFSISKRQPLGLRLFNYTIKLLSLAKKADLIYVQNSVATGLPAIIVKMLTRTPVVINFAEDEAWKRALNLRLTTKSYNDFLKGQRSNRKTNLIMKLQAWILRQASAVVLPSNFLGKTIADVYGIREQSVFTNYIVEDKKTKIPFAVKKEKYQIFTVGALLDWSGISDTIKAFSIVEKKFPQARLLISGAGDAKEKLQRIAHDLAIVDKVKFLGKISQAQEAYLRQGSAMYIYNLKANDFSHNISAAWLTDLPLVAADTEVAQEITSDYGGGLLFKSGEPHDLAQKIQQVFVDDELSKKLIAQGNENLTNRFSWSVHLDNLDNIFKSLLN